MPDWSYQTMFRPLLFRLPAPQARALTLGALGRLGGFRFGAQIIALMGHMRPAESLAREALGLRFDTPVGLGADLPGNEQALEALSRFGVGCVEVGPVALVAGTAGAFERLPSAGAVELRGERALTAAQLADRLATAGSLPARVAVRLVAPFGSPLGAAEAVRGAIARLSSVADLFTLAPTPAGWSAETRRVYLSAALDAAAQHRRPLLVGLPLDALADVQDALAAEAVEAGAAGVLLCGPVAGPDGARLLGAPAFEPALEAVARIQRRWGSRLALWAAGGAQSPEQALALFDAGADMVLLDAGMVYTGPGLPKRINEALRFRDENRPDINAKAQGREDAEDKNFHAVASLHPDLQDSQALAADQPTQGYTNADKHTNLCASASLRLCVLVRRLLDAGWLWMLLLGLGLAVSGALAWAVAATRVVLPYDEVFVGMSLEQLAAVNPRLLAFMTHDRVSLAGTMIAIGVLYVQLAWHALRRREHWAAAVIVPSAVLGFLSFFLFLGYGYFDPLHGLVVLLLLPLYMLGRRARADAPPHIPAPDLRNDRAWRLAQWGQLGFVGLGAGLTLAGAAIATVGVTEVFVPEDLAFLCTTRAALLAVDARLVALIAHDRAGFGGALVSNGVAVLLLSLWGIRRGARWVWWTLLASGVPGFAAALGVHWAVGYLDLWHLFPGLVALAVFALSLGLLYPFLAARR
ncbi:MAG TPA: hypothetical protein VFS21_02770 [Roseiflexaceae bacterium]|nr:hypothetical protein [Roseiflexaceae bacterium]